MLSKIFTLMELNVTIPKDIAHFEVSRQRKPITRLVRGAWTIHFSYENLLICYVASSRASPNKPKKFVIQIKICAEYRDMLPRPRLVCQEPGLRPIGRSPGVPDKSSRGLGSMSRYSAQILICFIAYIFQFSISLWVWLGTLQNCHHAQCPLPLFIVIRMRLLSAHQTIKSPSMPCWGAAGRNTLWHSCHRTGEISR